MTDDSVVLTGEVTPGPTMEPPYTNEVRCVIWAAGRAADGDASASGALPFGLRGNDGVEVAVEPAGAAALLAVRSGIDFETVNSAGRTKIRAPGEPTAKGETVTRHSRVVAWVAVGDTVTVEGRLVSAAPFRGRPFIAATSLRTAGGTLRVAALLPGEPEPEKVFKPPIP